MKHTEVVEEIMKQAEAEKVYAEIGRLIAETGKINAEAAKIIAESRWYPLVVVAGIFAAAVGFVKILAA